MARKKESGNTTFALYWVRTCEATGNDDGTLNLRITATPDIADDLLTAALALYGMNAHDVAVMQRLLAPGPWREKLEHLKAQCVAAKIMEE